MNIRKCDLYIRGFWIALSLFVSTYSYNLGIGKFVDPGPGLLPFLLGLVFLVLSSVRLVSVMRQRVNEKEEEPGEGAVSYWKLTMVVAALLGWGLTLESLGFLVATFILMTILYRAAGFERLRVAAIWGLGTVLVAYFIFTYLGVRFPPGILRPLGLG